MSLSLSASEQNINPLLFVSACFAGVATSHRAREQFRNLRGKVPICLVLPFPVENEPA